MLKLSIKPRINLRVKKAFKFNGRIYNVGDKFHVVGENDMRGWDVQDEKGNIIYETAMSDNFERIN